ncbi:MBL fold metallo-hydrolase [Massilia sp. CF038]|uniref:MBL fold metallo-hydrolase n=1 Tax=Massilia sp. CF038 TaxID=1881045 RepID=UPI00091582CF|nr:MBL fold metallo-hydrolase [Massilia sp. CF038]SHG66195.1 Beta-lactamase superfamily domain-containing protein [Massilia sp. CF038]
MSLKLSRILHAGYVFECEGRQIAFDPIFENPFSRNCHAFPDVRFDLDQIRQARFAAVFISHFHDDHCSMESLDLLDRSTPIYLYCQFEAMFDMIRALGFRQVHALQVDVEVTLGPFTVTAREAIDADVDAMFQVRAGGMNVLNVVDAWIAPVAMRELAAQAPWDMVLWPFQTMREVEVLSPSRARPEPVTLPEEWIDQLRKLDPRYIVPSSCQFVQETWSWYNHAFFPISYRQFQADIEAALPGARVARLNPGVAVVLDATGLSTAAPLSWVLPVGEQDVDYDYRPDLPAPTSAQIATRFPALDAAQAARVQAFCQHGLLEKYRAMELEEGGYFDQPRLWRLSLYDHEGACVQWHYRVVGDSIALAQEGSAPLAWTTEISQHKLYAALELGESLTSLYLRINDMVFAPPEEAALEDAELVDDPLIRCLFNDAFGAYQAAQLRRLGVRWQDCTDQETGG